MYKTCEMEYGEGVEGIVGVANPKWGKRGWFCMCGWLGGCVYATLPQFQILVTQYSAPSAGTTLTPDLFNFQLNKKVRSSSNRASDIISHMCRELQMMELNVAHFKSQRL